MKAPFHPIVQWLLFVPCIIMMGLWFLASPFRKDEQKFFAENFGLNTKLGPNDGDSVEEAWEALATSSLVRIPHHMNNVVHEWTKEYPKRAAKFFCCIIVAQAAAIIWLF